MTKERCAVSLEPNRPVRVTTIFSECDQMPVNHAFHLQGPMLQPTPPGAVCVTALSAVYPWIMAARFGIESRQMDWTEGYKVWCAENRVQFLIETVWDE